ncbi:MAG TPA: ankyrin repeat domain-containing protein [bacterium]|nr:ankyrin repeat domain-containing protein [bacterium]
MKRFILIQLCIVFMFTAGTGAEDNPLSADLIHKKKLEDVYTNYLNALAREDARQLLSVLPAERIEALSQSMKMNGMAFPDDYFTVVKELSPPLPPVRILRYIGISTSGKNANLIYIGDLKGFLRKTESEDMFLMICFVKESDQWKFASIHDFPLSIVPDLESKLAKNDRDFLENQPFSAETPEDPPLIAAIEQGNVKVVKELLKSGADIEATNSLGRTSLACAAWMGQREIAEILIAAGAEVNSRDRMQNVPLLGALWQSHPEIAEMLVKHGADVNVRDRHQFTPLHVAAWKGQVDAARVLLENGADANAKQEGKVTPIGWAVQEQHVEMVQFLLDHGADPNIHAADGMTPLHWAAERGDEKITRVLLENGADVNGIDSDGNSPLHIAVWLGFTPVVTELLTHNADPTLKDKNGDTPIQWAQEAGRREIAGLLRQAAVKFKK